jgi:hypothetical protein
MFITNCVSDKQFYVTFFMSEFLQINPAYAVSFISVPYWYHEIIIPSSPYKFLFPWNDQSSCS